MLEFTDLQRLCNPGKRPRLATVEAWARRQGIPFQYDGRGGIWTTLDALNAALGVRSPANDSNNYAADEFI